MSTSSLKPLPSTSTMPTIFCQTCSSEQTPTTLKQAFITPCCASPICMRCVSLNPRLRDYVPCLKCGDPRTAELRGAGRPRRDSQLRHRDRERRLGSGRNIVGGVEGGGGEVVFEIGDVDDDDDGANELMLAGLPKYDEIHPSNTDIDNVAEGGGGGFEDNITVQSGVDGPSQESAKQQGTSNDPVNDDDLTSGQQHQQQNKHESENAGEPDTKIKSKIDTEAGIETEIETETETVEVRHTVLRSDNLLAIARKYAADPHDLLTLNNLPPATLSTNPRLLHTRKSIIISRRVVPSRPFNEKGQNQDPLEMNQESELIDEAREKEKSLKRFQLITKSLEPGVGETYLSLAQLDGDGDGDGDGDAAETPGSGSRSRSGSGFDYGAYETACGNDKKFDSTSALKEQEKEKDQDPEKEKVKHSLSGRGRSKGGDKHDATETRALEAFFDDEQWENAVGASALESYRSKQGKWNSIGVGAGAGIGAISRIGQSSGFGSGSSVQGARGGGGGAGAGAGAGAGVWSIFGKVR
ncbi:hypothetical protein IAT40_003639 [Kwoniella sp. CBS 6097]